MVSSVALQLVFSAFEGSKLFLTIVFHFNCRFPVRWCVNSSFRTLPVAKAVSTVLFRTAASCQFQQFSSELKVPAIFNRESSRLELCHCDNFEKVSVISERCFSWRFTCSLCFSTCQSFRNAVFVFLTADISIYANIYWTNHKITDWIARISLQCLFWLWLQRRTVPIMSLLSFFWGAH